MNPLTWNDLPSIHDVPRVDDADGACLEEIREVLARHGKTRRFGVALLHQHFLVMDSEVLVEHCDDENRTLTTRPEASSGWIEKTYIPTLWRFDGRRPQVCGYCPTHGDQHDGYKEPH